MSQYHHASLHQIRKYDTERLPQRTTEENVSEKKGENQVQVPY